MIYKFSSKVWLGDGDTTFLRGEGDVTAYKSPISLTNDTNTLFFHIENDGGLTTYKVEAFNFQNVVEGMTINDCTHISFGDGITMCTSKCKCVEARPTVGKFNFEYAGGGFVYNDDTMGNGNPNPDEPTDGIVFYYNTQNGEPLGLEGESPATKRFFTPEGTEIQHMYKASLDSFDIMGGKTVEWLIFEEGTATAPSVLGEIFAKFVVFPDSVVNWSDNSLSYVLGSTGFIRMNLSHYTNWFEHNSGLRNGGCNIIICNTEANGLNMRRDVKIYDSEVLTGSEINIYVGENMNSDIWEGCNVIHSFADAPFTYQTPIMYQSEDFRSLSLVPFKVDLDGETYTINTFIQRTDTDTGFKLVECVGFNVGETIIELNDELSESLVGLDCQKIRNLGGNHTIALTYSDVVNLYEIYRDDTTWYVPDELIPTYIERYSAGATYLPISTLE